VQRIVNRTEKEKEWRTKCQRHGGYIHKTCILAFSDMTPCRCVMFDFSKYPASFIFKDNQFFFHEKITLKMKARWAFERSGSIHWTPLCVTYKKTWLLSDTIWQPDTLPVHYAWCKYEESTASIRGGGGVENDIDCVKKEPIFSCLGVLNKVLRWWPRYLKVGMTVLLPKYHRTQVATPSALWTRQQYTACSTKWRTLNCHC
jgi:hypothetical protein